MEKKPNHEQVRVEVLLDIYYTSDLLRERAIHAAVNCVLDSPVYGANYTVMPVESKIIDKPLEKTEVVGFVFYRENCKHYDLAQGRHKCTCFSTTTKCNGVCEFFDEM